MADRGYSISVQGNNMQPVEITYNPDDRFWTLNLRPRGPGKSIVRLGDEVVAQLLERRANLIALEIIKQ